MKVPTQSLGLKFVILCSKEACSAETSIEARSLSLWAFRYGVLQQGGAAGVHQGLGLAVHKATANEN